MRTRDACRKCNDRSPGHANEARVAARSARDYSQHRTRSGAAFAINNDGYIVGYVWTLDEEAREHAALWRDGVLTDLGTLGGQYSTAWGVSELGVVVGHAERADGRSRGFVWENGTMTELPTLGGNFGRAMGINRAGKVVGTSGTVSGDQRATLWLRR